MPRRAVGTSVLIERRGKAVLAVMLYALVVPRRARGGQQMSAAQSDNGMHHRGGGS
ncbi:hypothetical protein LF1_57050 [Rubripirellula obstinata]|uniref:Uncharacterized protein n=1 Tax=Rubripirellula obstinata TaxID=406547 RepID=A0A5B1C7E3_9BACT|nr:hypothetical protein LF1_57050 [Rubripirellula obstinata]